jgi:tungstate transport system substrate-binding protein
MNQARARALGRCDGRPARHVRLLVGFAVAWAAVLVAACMSSDAQPPQQEIVLLTTTTTQDSGILAALVEAFERTSKPFKVKPIVAGSGDILKQAAAGEGDVVLTHSPEAELEWMKGGNGTSRRLVMYNDFVIAGPAADPAGIRGLAPDVALRTIAERGDVFVSRGDQSGTHVRERKLWKSTGVDPKGQPWYRETGQGQGLTMEVASQQGGYVFTDRGTLLVHRQRLALTVLVEGDARLRNIYHVMTVSPTKFPKVNAAGGEAFADFVVSPEAQALIGSFGRERVGQSLFTPVAHLTDEALAPLAPEAATK